MSDTTTTRKRTIFDIHGDLDQIAMAFDQLAETGEEQAVLDAVEAYFGNLLDERDTKLDNYSLLIDDYSFKAELQEREARRLLDLAKANKNAAQRLKERLKIYFELNGITKLDTSFHKFWIQKNGGKVPVRLLPQFTEDPSKLPVEFQVMLITPNTDAIRAELQKESAEQLYDMSVIAELAEVGTHLRIK
jgi:hypothetical protein